MKNSIKLRFLMVVSLICLILSPALSKANESYEPKYVRSVYVEVWMPYSKPHVFYEENGYRGWLGLTNNTMTVGNVFMRQYAGKIYHPSVKDIPAPTKNNQDFSISNMNDDILADSKYVTKIVTYKCTWKEYWDLKCKIPLQIFYNDGVFKGYLYHKDSDPVDIGSTTVKVTYRGTVFRNNYPAPTKISNSKY